MTDWTGCSVEMALMRIPKSVNKKMRTALAKIKRAVSLAERSNAAIRRKLKKNAVVIEDANR